MDIIIPYIEPFYPEAEVKRIVHELETYRKTLPTVPKHFPVSSWYKDSAVYFLYPEAAPSWQGTPLRNVTAHLKQVKLLGCSAIHLLPFLESPMGDRGYDVSDYYKVRDGLGGMTDLKAVLKEAHELGLHVFMDLIFNHASAEHEWFRKAQAGDAHYREYFIHTKDQPQFLKSIRKDSGVWAEYLVDGEKTMVSVAFPELTGEIPHWVQGRDGYWYYHTFYPHQIDLNWKNPEVFIELSKVLLFWASLGFNFRFDAMPFIGKSAYKHLNTHNAFTHHLIAVLNIMAEQVHPDCIFLLEIAEELESEIEYFGTTNTRQSHMLYNFQLTAQLWGALVTGEVSHLWRQLKQDQRIPTHATWVNFLRSHDDLGLGWLEPTLRQKVYAALEPHGKAFDAGFSLGGRTYSLLGANEERFLMSYFLLASLPGGMLIPYGDEYGMRNTPESALSEAARKDSRNINRGPLTHELMRSEKGKRLFQALSGMLEVRQLLHNYRNVWPEALSVPDGVFGASYTAGISEFVVLVNLTDAKKQITLEAADFQKVAGVNRAEFTASGVALGPYGGIWLQK
jgi:maltose alpha-D-glucosyltransferase/alpha-amylase